MGENAITFKAYMFFFIFVSIAIILIFLAVIIKNAVDNNIEDILEENLIKYTNVVNNIYETQSKDMLKSTFYLANTVNIKDSLSQNNIGSLELILNNLKSSESAEIVLLTNNKGIVIAGEHNKISNQLTILKDMVIYSMNKSIPILSTEKISYEELERINPEFILLTKTRRIPSIYQENRIQDVYVTDALAQVVVVPIKDKNQTIGSILLINILNRDYEIPRIINETLNLQSSIYLDDVTISTSINTRRNNPYIGSLFPEPAYNKVFGQNDVFFGRIWADNTWTRKVYLPLNNYKSEVVGAIGFGMNEDEFRNQKFLSYDLDMTQIIIVSTLLALIISALFALLMSDHFIKPIKKLIRSIDQADKGNLDQGMTIHWFKEMNELAKHYNILIRDLRHKFHKKK